MKKILGIFLSIVLLITIVGCARVVDTESKTIEVSIAEVNRNPAIMIGEVYYPANYDMTIKYKNTEAFANINKSQYNEYKELVGTTVRAHLIVQHYDNNTKRQYIELSEGEISFRLPRR